ncbi:MAG: guanylate kinase [Bacteroidales bacterium]|jgi:guanylate kinase|nr:guanylate kinase [Bacteroidales bacterium]MDD2570283.1 guanylate kinase [Bacteroidales bacterium]MDD2811966.1 guanylate kinase [Bacteroidales bacterium]MDD3384322.1 guanylate kinase [Bacteroidales bacterium]MDD3811971.1 guanylate kinase [Bacteroidales bacterium]
MWPEELKVVILSAPSGSGKTTIARHLLSAELGLEFSVSACSRDKRPRETDGKDYYFLSIEEFKKQIDAGGFIEWEEVYQGHLYGTLRSEIERIHSLGHAILFDVDVKGGINLKRIFGKQALALFIMPPSIQALEQRLKNRGTDSPEKISLRLAKAEYEMTFASGFDVTIVNDQLETALREAEQVVRNFLHGSE